MLASSRLPWSLWAVLIAMMGLLGYGIVLVRTDPAGALPYIQEDGPIEWLTVVSLAGCLILAILMTVACRRQKKTLATWAWALAAFAFCFGAMEEISWGQRILRIESPEWFKLHNKQGETTIHNLELWGIDFNKVFFSKGLGIILGIYLLVIPLLYRRSGGFRRFADRIGMPVPQNYQILLFMAAAVAVETSRGLLPKDRVGELLEFAGCTMFFLILAHPFNGAQLPKVSDVFRSPTASGPVGPS